MSNIGKILSVIIGVGIFLIIAIALFASFYKNTYQSVPSILVPQNNFADPYAGKVCLDANGNESPCKG